MTEAEALAELKSFPVNCLDFREQMALDMAIEALEEVQRYRAIGTVEGFERAIQSSIENYNLYREYKAKAQEVAKEYGDGWIPCEIALPKEATTYEVTCEIILCSEKQYITTYALWGTEGEWICRKNERVIAWKEKSAPYQKGE